MTGGRSGRPPESCGRTVTDCVQEVGGGRGRSWNLMKFLSSILVCRNTPIHPLRLCGRMDIFRETTLSPHSTFLSPSSHSYVCVPVHIQTPLPANTDSHACESGMAQRRTGRFDENSKSAEERENPIGPFSPSSILTVSLRHNATAVDAVITSPKEAATDPTHITFACALSSTWHGAGRDRLKHLIKKRTCRSCGFHHTPCQH